MLHTHKFFRTTVLRHNKRKAGDNRRFSPHCNQHQRRIIEQVFAQTAKLRRDSPRIDDVIGKASLMRALPLGALQPHATQLTVAVLRAPVRPCHREGRSSPAAAPPKRRPLGRA